jgi:hypothetical protein
MGTLINLPNITFDSLVVEENDTTKKKNNVFDVKNYLNTRIPKGETEVTRVIRLLPMDLETGNPFAIVHIHNVKVPQDLVEAGKKPFKNYICLAKNDNIDHERFGNKCPYCELNQKAYHQSQKETDPVIKKNLIEISCANLSKKAVICRCIERGKEDEGVKFWMFNLRNDKTDPYNQIIKLASLRKENAERRGRTENILDIYEGRDLAITFTEGTAAPKVVDDGDRSPLSDNEALMKQWIFDEKKWQDVFTCKPYEYLELVAQMKTPWFDRKQNKWVDKETLTQPKNDEVEDINEQIDEVKTELTTNNPVDTSFASSLEVSDDDMPF